jgi:hypothetical protein
MASCNYPSCSHKGQVSHGPKSTWGPCYTHTKSNSTQEDVTESLLISCQLRNLYYDSSFNKGKLTHTPSLVMWEASLSLSIYSSWKCERKKLHRACRIFILQGVNFMCLKLWDIGWIMFKKLKIYWMNGMWF